MDENARATPGAAGIPPGLSAPELDVLFHGPDIGDRRAVTSALQDLVWRGALRFEMVKPPTRFDHALQNLYAGWDAGEYVFMEGEQPDLRLPGPLQAVLQVYSRVRAAHSERGWNRTFPSGHVSADGTPVVHVWKVAYAVFNDYGSIPWRRGRGYIKTEVMPRLAAIGFCEPKRGGAWRSNAAKWVLTAEGARVRYDLQDRWPVVVPPGDTVSGIIARQVDYAWATLRDDY